MITSNVQFQVIKNRILWHFTPQFDNSNLCVNFCCSNVSFAFGPIEEQKKKKIVNRVDYFR